MKEASASASPCLSPSPTLAWPSGKCHGLRWGGLGFESRAVAFQNFLFSFHFRVMRLEKRKFGRCPVRNPGRGEGIRERPRLGTERASLGRIPPIREPPRTGGVKRDGGARQSPWVECLRPIEEQISLSLDPASAGGAQTPLRGSAS